jgi:hypothetical protein
MVETPWPAIGGAGVEVGVGVEVEVGVGVEVEVDVGVEVEVDVEVMRGEGVVVSGAQATIMAVIKKKQDMERIFWTVDFTVVSSQASAGNCYTADWFRTAPIKGNCATVRTNLIIAPNQVKRALTFIMNVGKMYSFFLF